MTLASNTDPEHPSECSGPFDSLAVRDDFPILSTETSPGVPLVYLDSAASAQRSRAVLDAMAEVERSSYSNVHRGIHTLSERATKQYEAAREKVARWVNAAASEEIVFTKGTTEGINLVARSYGDANISAGDEILLTILEHHSNIVPWQQLAARRGAKVRFLPITDDGQLQLDVLDEYLTPRTKVVSLASVSNTLGTINPVRRIADAAHAAGAVVVVDAAQSVPHQSTDVEALGVDFLAFSGHKMTGPSGIGVLWGRQELLDAMPPFQGGGSMIHQVTVDGFTPAALPAKFEAGTPPIVAAIGLGAAVDYLDKLGLEAIAAHERNLAERAHELLAPIRGLRILGPEPTDKAGIVSFVFDGGPHAYDVAQIVDRSGVAVRSGHHCTMPLHERLGIAASVRASFYLYNTLDDVERLAAALVQAVELVGSERPRLRKKRGG